MRVVVVHDYLTQQGGAERVVLEIARAFGATEVVASAYDAEGTFPEFQDLRVTTLMPPRLRSLIRDPRHALPMLGRIFRNHTIDDADLVLCSSSGFAHQISTPAPKIVYCHNPPRWLHQTEDYLADQGLLPRLALHALRRRLLREDLAGARGATHYLANSHNVAARIHSAYGLTATVVHPPRGLSPNGPEQEVPGLAPGFLLTVGRPRGYKRTGLLVDAVAEMPDLTLVTVGGEADDRLPSNIRQLGRVPDSQLRWLYRRAGALLACSHEDFGLTPVEAFGFGLPVGATPEGGYLETCVAGLSGLWLDVSSRAALQESIRALLDRTWDRGAIRQHGRRWEPGAFYRDLTETVASILHGGLHEHAAAYAGRPTLPRDRVAGRRPALPTPRLEGVSVPVAPLSTP